MPTRPKPNDTLLAYIKVQKDHDRKLYAILNRTVSAVDSDLRALIGRENIGATIRRDQLLAVKRTVLERLGQMMTDAGYMMQALKYEAAAAAITNFKTYDAMLMRAVGDQEIIKAYLRSAAVTSAVGIASAEQRLLGASYRSLAESVYKTQQLQAGVVDRYVEAALGRGLSARELAKGVRDLIKPGVRGGVSYAALRLGRTEINNAFHATAAQRAREAPWVLGSKWNLSGSHPTPDKCNEYAEEVHERGKPPGVYLPDDIPAKPHPQCLCFITPEVEDEDSFLDSFFAGAYDTFLASQRR